MLETAPKNAVDQRIAKAFAHPLRVQILIILNERVASPNKLAKELGESLNLVAYHVRVLEKFECIELVKTKQRRGATEHFYRATRRQFFTDQEWEKMPGALRPGISSAVLKMVFEDVREAVTHNTFDEFSDRHLTRTPMVVDDEGLARRSLAPRRHDGSLAGDSGRDLRAARGQPRGGHALEGGDPALQVAPAHRGATGRVEKSRREPAQELSGTAASGVATTKVKLSSR